MKIATWNVNSIRARLERALAWLDRHEPDVLCLQELKVTDDAFPTDVFEQAGYRSAVHGQKTYNGVAILTRSDPSDVACGLNDRSAPGRRVRTPAPPLRAIRSFPRPDRVRQPFRQPNRFRPPRRPC